MDEKFWKQTKRLYICQEFIHKYEQLTSFVMGNFKKLQEARKEVREKEKTSRETLGKYFYDLSKLTFGAMVLGVVVPWFSTNTDESYWLLLSLGAMGTFSLAVLGYNVIKK